jgi:hypothetical protein
MVNISKKKLDELMEIKKMYEQLKQTNNKQVKKAIKKSEFISQVDKSIKSANISIGISKSKNKKLEKEFIDLQPDAKRIKEDIKNKLSNRKGKTRQPVTLIDVKAKIKFSDNSVDWRTLSYVFHANYNQEIAKQVIERDLYNNYEVKAVLKIEVTDYKLKYQRMEHIKMKHLSLGYKFLNDINGYIDEVKEDNLCGLRYIVNTLKGKKGFKKFDMDVLKSQLDCLKINYNDGISVNDMLRWIKEYYPNNISMYALNPYGKCFQKYTVQHSVGVLVYICNNQHMYPIYNDKLKTHVALTKKMDHSVDLQFKYHATDYEYVSKFKLLEDDGDYDIDEDEEFTTDYSKKLFDPKYQDLVSGKILSGQVYLVDDPYLCALDVIKETKYNITNMKIKEGQLTAFIHPISGHIIENGGQYHQRQLICKRFMELCPCHEFEFRNQSYAQMVATWFEIKVGKIGLKSSYTEEQLRITDTFSTTPLIDTLVDMIQNKNCKAFDRVGSYPNAVIEMKYNYPVFSICDDFIKYDGGDILCGEYLVESFTIKQLGRFRFQKQILSYNIVIYLLENKYISKTQITLFRKASFSIKAHKLSDFMKELMSLIPRSKYDGAKLLYNSFIGSLGKKYIKEDKGFLTTDFETVCAMYYEQPEGYGMTKLDNVYFVRHTTEKRIDQDHGPIYRQILCQGMINLLELTKSAFGQESRLIGYNTDSVFIENPKYFDLGSKYRVEEWKPKAYKQFEVRDDKIELTDLKEWNKLDGTEDLPNMSFCCTGIAGSGKTTQAKKCYIHGETLVLCPTNKACQNILLALRDGHVFTFDAKFYNQEGAENILNGVKRIIVDEYSMIPMRWINKLYQLKKQGVIIQLYGDPKQCTPVDIRYIDYMQKKAFREICDNNILEKEYIEGKGRFDKPLFEFLTYFDKHQRIPSYLSYKRLMKKPSTSSICKTNLVRWSVIDEIYKDLICDKVEKYFFKGLRVISNINDKIIFRSRFYYIVDVQGSSIALSEMENGEPIKNKKGEVMYYNLKKKIKDNDEEKYIVDPAFCTTCYKYQGDTIYEDYNIYELSKMSFNEAFTSFSRGVALDKVHFDYINRFFPRAKESNTPTDVDFIKIKKAEIYEMCNLVENKFYVGYTTTNTKKRFNEHKEFLNDPIHKHGNLEDWKAKRIHYTYYFIEDEIRKVETIYIWKYAEDKELINTQKVPKKCIKYEVKAPAIDDSVREKYHISVSNGMVRLRYQENGIRKNRDIRFGKKKTQEQAMEEMMKIKQQLISCQ